MKGQGGDVDANGDLVGELNRSVWLASDRVARLRAAIGDTVAVDPAEHLHLVVGLVGNAVGRPYE